MGERFRTMYRLPVLLASLLLLALPAAAELEGRDPYLQLEQSLAVANWREAHQQTRMLLLSAAGREAAGWLDEAAFRTLECVPVRRIDQIWRRASNNRFGFSVQNRIWRELTGKSTPAEVSDFNAAYDRFAERVGWRRGEEWLSDAKLDFSATAPEGHLSPFGREACFFSFLSMLTRCGL